MLMLVAFTILSFTLMAIATIRNWRDANRSEAAKTALLNEQFEHGVKIRAIEASHERQIDGLNAYGNGLVDKIKTWQTDAETWERRFREKNAKCIEYGDEKLAWERREEELLNQQTVLEQELSAIKRALAIPQLFIKYELNEMHDSFSFKNEGPGSVQNIEFGPVSMSKYDEHDSANRVEKTLQITPFSGVGLILAGEEHRNWRFGAKDG